MGYKYGKVTTYNANRPHGFGMIDPVTFVPFPKHPVIAAFFREIDRTDKLGSGMRNLVKYGKCYGGSDPQLIEHTIPRKTPEPLAKISLDSKRKGTTTLT